MKSGSIKKDNSKGESMKQSIQISMLISALMLNVSHPLFAAQPPKSSPTGWKIERAGEPSIVLPISKQEIEQEVEKAAGKGRSRAFGGIKLPAGSIIVCGLSRLEGTEVAFIMKFATDSRGIYQIDPSFGSSIKEFERNPIGWWRKNGIIFRVDFTEENPLGYDGVCLANKGAKPDEFLFVPWFGSQPKCFTRSVQDLMGERDVRSQALMNDRGDIIRQKFPQRIQ